jgi:Predicted membrane protein (DUF2306)
MIPFTRIPTYLFWFLCLGIAIASWRFLIGGVEATMGFVAYHAQDRQLAFFAHVGLAPVALALVPFQLTRRLRTWRPALHRWMGRSYGAAVLLSGLGGLSMAINTQAGWIASVGFSILAVLWLGTTTWGIWLATQGRIQDHRRWMIRSVALTFAAVTLRLYLPVLAATTGLETGYSLVAWLCWVPNLILVELWLAQKQRPQATA